MRTLFLVAAFSTVAFIGCVTTKPEVPARAEPTATPPPSPPKDESLPEMWRPDPEPEQPITIASNDVFCDNAQILWYDWWLLIVNDSFIQRLLYRWTYQPYALRAKLLKERGVALWQRVEEMCPSEVVTALARSYVEWATKVRKEAPAFAVEALQKPKRISLQKFSDRFATAVRTLDSYAGLVEDPKGNEFFERFPLLTDPFFTLGTLKTSVEDPKTLNDTLARMKETVQRLPPYYAALFQKLKLYVSLGMNDIKALCQWEGAWACYNLETDTMYIQATAVDPQYERTLAHEMGHAFADHLPPRERAAFRKAMSDLLASSPAAQQDVVRDSTGHVNSWKDGSVGPRYFFVRPYGSSNTDEHLATYIEDLLANRGQAVVALLKTGHRREVIKTLTALEQAGFFGERNSALLLQVYRDAGLGNAAVRNSK